MSRWVVVKCDRCGVEVREGGESRDWLQVKLPTNHKACDDWGTCEKWHEVAIAKDVLVCQKCAVAMARLLGRGVQL